MPKDELLQYLLQYWKSIAILQQQQPWLLTVTQTTIKSFIFILADVWEQSSYNVTIMEIGEAIKNPAYRIFQTEYSGCLDISAHA